MASDDVRHQLESVSQRLRISKLRGTVGLMSYEASRNNYTAAAKYSREFFDGVRTAIEQTKSADVKRPLEATLAHRDEITTDLAQANPAVKEKLIQMYINFFHIDSSA
jgi:hypothetical protein